MDKTDTNSKKTKISLDGDNLLITKGENRRRLSLKEVNIEEIKKYRDEKIPVCILKIGDKLLLTEINKTDDFRFANLELFEEEKPFHVCGDCSHCVATAIKNGGCLQVLENRYIHNYPFIAVGIETMGCTRNLNRVLKCKNYEKGRLKLNKVGIEYFI